MLLEQYMKNPETFLMRAIPYLTLDFVTISSQLRKDFRTQKITCHLLSYDDFTGTLTTFFVGPVWACNCVLWRHRVDRFYDDFWEDESDSDMCFFPRQGQSIHDVMICCRNTTSTFNELTVVSYDSIFIFFYCDYCMTSACHRRDHQWIFTVK